MSLSSRLQPSNTLPQVFLDAPHVLSPADLAETFNTTEELGAAEAEESDPALQPRGWWKVDRGRMKMNGIEASLDLLRDTLQKDRYVVSNDMVLYTEIY